MKRHRFTVAKSEDGLRLDQYLAQTLAGVGEEISKRKIRQIIDVGGVYQNRRRVRVASRQVRIGDILEVEFDMESLRRIRANNFALTDADVLFESSDIIAINKPPGLPAQATRDQSVMHAQALVENYLAAKYAQTSNQRTPAKKLNLILVHRLDKETSGVLLLAKNSQAATFLTDQFRERIVAKQYEAICYGVPAHGKFVQKCYLSEIDKKTGMVVPVRSGGKDSETSFEVMASEKALGLSLIRCFPKTGRSHQIRVHLDMLGLSIVGDKRYYSARRPLPEALAKLAAVHHFLHAAAISFAPAPGSSMVTVTAPRPPNFSAFLNATPDLM